MNFDQQTGAKHAGQNHFSRFYHLFFFFMLSPLVRRHLSDLLRSIFRSTFHILHITNHDGPSVWAAILVLHSRHLLNNICMKLAKIAFLVTDENMGLCLCIYPQAGCDPP